MKTSFKQWIALQEIAMGSDGQRDNQSVQTAQSTAQVAQNWLADKSSAPQQTSIVNGLSNRSALAGKLLDAGTSAIQGAPTSMAKKTTAPAVAGFLQQQFKLPNVVKTQSPVGTFMRKGMKKK